MQRRAAGYGAGFWTTVGTRSEVASGEFLRMFEAIPGTFENVTPPGRPASAVATGGRGLP